LRKEIKQEYIEKTQISQTLIPAEAEHLDYKKNFFAQAVKSLTKKEKSGLSYFHFVTSTTLTQSNSKSEFHNNLRLIQTFIIIPQFFC